MTDEERRALAYIMIEDPDAWHERITNHFSPKKAAEVITFKIQKALILVADISEEDYTTKAERDALADMVR